MPGPLPRRVEGTARDVRYELLGELASGGMATVYVARRTTREGTGFVAVKSMHPELATDEAFAAMFLDEATLTARIKHPNVVETLDVVSADGKLLIVMEYVEGVSLAKLLEAAWASHTALPPEVAVAVLCDVLGGLHAAHELVDERGKPLSVVHRDVSPQNILIGLDGVSRLLDFGVAKAAIQRHVTERGEIKGKLSYMPPEQQLGERVDRRSDVYAAGVVLWETLVGRRLFSASDEDELVRQVFEARIDPPSQAVAYPLPSVLDQVVMRALSRKREDRWWSAEQMASVLRGAIRPAPPEQVASVVGALARAEIEERARHVRRLAAAPVRQLEGEEQSVLEVLTARGNETLPKPAPPSAPATKVSSPAARDRAKERSERELEGLPRTGETSSPASAHSSESRSRSQDRRERRAQRRSRRRLQLVLVLSGIGLMILILMVMALVLGRKTRESEVESPAATFPPPPVLPTSEPALDPSSAGGPSAGPTPTPLPSGSAKVRRTPRRK